MSDKLGLGLRAFLEPAMRMPDGSIRVWTCIDGLQELFEMGGELVLLNIQTGKVVFVVGKLEKFKKRESLDLFPASK